MKWSWKVGKVAGIDLFVHATFFLLLAWILFSHWLAGRSFASAMEGLAFVLALFGCVVLHELGHGLTAARYGIRTRDITLYPIGGVARLERMPEEPAQELRVAAAGPAVSLAIAVALGGALALTGTIDSQSRLVTGAASFVERLAFANLILAAFNMIPAFPMDGGRVLRAALALRMDYMRATQIAAGLGQGFAILLGLVGLLWNPILLFIAFFVWIAATQESSATQLRAGLGGVPVERVMIRDFRTLSPADSLDRAVSLVLAGWQPDFPVVYGDRVAGMLRKDDLLAALGRRERDVLVGEVMLRNVERVDSFDMLDGALTHMMPGGFRTLPVVHGGKLVGVLSAENIGEFLSIQAALRGQRSRNDARLAGNGRAPRTRPAV